MKKRIATQFICLFMLCALTASALAGCGRTGANTEDNGKINIVTTIFPEYDWVMNILGERADKAEVTMLLDNGVDLHSYQPTADDMLMIAGCDVFIYVGGESDGWVDDALKSESNPDRVVINLLDVLGDSVKEEELVEGMQGEEEEEEGEEDEEEGPEYDEHVWLSLKNASIICDAIEGALAGVDSEGASVYEKNCADYKAELSALDAEYAKAAESGKVKTILFGDRFPFRYMTDDYGLDYYAAFVGCSAETEASFETIIFLANKVDELGLSSIITIEKSDGRIAGTIRDNTSAKDQKILTLDSMQSVTSDDVVKGESYLSIMKSNLEVLKEALN